MAQALYGQWKVTAYDLRTENARVIGAITLFGSRAEVENTLLALRCDLPSGYGAVLEFVRASIAPAVSRDPLA